MTESALYLAEATSRRSLTTHGGDAWILEAQAHAQDLAAAGITRVGDAAVSPEFDLLYQRAVTADMLPITVHRMPIGTQSLLASRTAGSPTGTGPARSPVGAAKLFLDGGESCAICLSVGEAVRVLGRVVTQTARGGEGLAAVRAALHGEPVRPGRDFKLHRGTLFWDDHRLAAAIADAADHGLQTAQHAMGNEAIDQATRVLRALGPRLDPLPGRPRLEHTVFCGPDLATRIADVGAIAVVSPIWLDELGPAFRNAAKLAGPSPIPLNTLAKSGVTLAGASDYPSAHYRVLPAIQAAVTRRVISDGTLYGPEEAITAEQAVRAYTTGAAAAVRVDDTAGSITVGKQADLVILSHNPLDVDPGLIGSIQVLRTYVAGAAVHGDGCTLGTDIAAAHAHPRQSPGGGEARREGPPS